MTLWIITFLILIFALPHFEPILNQLKKHFYQNKTLEELKHIITHLRLVKESLECGLVPIREDWERIETLPAPWGKLFYASLMELRNQGAPILPSLHRMISSLEEERELSLEAKTKSSQAFGQVAIAVVIVPIFAVILYFLLPGIEQFKGVFLSLVSACLMFGFLAFFWMLQMMEDARFGRISRGRRPWILSSKVFFEQMIADVSCGHPPDIAWSRAMQSLSSIEPDLLQYWGLQIWKPGTQPAKPIQNPVEESVILFGSEIRTAIQQSLTEGQGCLDRLDSIYKNFLLDLKMKINRELQVLPNQCLKPLFILVLPSVFLLLFGSMALSFGKMME